MNKDGSLTDGGQMRDTQPRGKRRDDVLNPACVDEEGPLQQLTASLWKAKGVTHGDPEHTAAELGREAGVSVARFGEKERGKQPEEEVKTRLRREFVALRILTWYNKAMVLVSLLYMTACAMFIAYFADEGISALVMCVVTVTFVSAGIAGFLMGAVWRLEQAVVSIQSRLVSDCEKEGLIKKPDC